MSYELDPEQERKREMTLDRKRRYRARRRLGLAPQEQARMHLGKVVRCNENSGAVLAYLAEVHNVSATRALEIVCDHYRRTGEQEVIPETVQEARAEGIATALLAAIRCNEREQAGMEAQRLIYNDARDSFGLDIHGCLLPPWNEISRCMVTLAKQAADAYGLLYVRED